jgi:predicted GNAT family N-acyltransferase
MTRVRELEPADAPALTTLYGEYDWWADREVDDVRRALAETELAVGIEGEARLLAAARVLTDYTYYANVFDVVVAADRRGDGLGAAVMRAVRDHPALASVDGLSLLCREGLVSFYESVGFELFDPEMEVPEGGTERLVRMTYEHDA